MTSAGLDEGADAMGTVPRLLAGLIVSLGLVGCGDTEADSDPGIVCRDGYVAHPDYGRDEDGCGPHGGVRNPFEDQSDAYFDAYPDGPPSKYVCRDGWPSNAVYQQGACSHHGGVARLAWPDGTQVTLYGPDGPVLIQPDGTTVRLRLGE